jgi:hypothetical protein
LRTRYFPTTYRGQGAANSGDQAIITFARSASGMTILGRSFIVNGTEKQKHLTLQIYQTTFTMFLVDFEILHLCRQKRPIKIKDQFIGTAIFLFLNILNNVTAE